MEKLNCWNFKNCGRYPGGPNSKEFGTCPVTTLEAADGFLGGRAAGRACAFVTGTFCDGSIQGTHLDKKKDCEKCSYYKALKQQFGRKMSVSEFRAYTQSDPSLKETTPDKHPWIEPPNLVEQSAKPVSKVMTDDTLYQ